MLWFFFFFKQKTAYEMRISDWSSDVCSSDLTAKLVAASVQQLPAFQGIPRKNFVTKPGMLIAKPGTLQKVASQICGGVYSMQYVTGYTTEPAGGGERSEEHTSELQSLMRISYAVFCLKKKKHNTPTS